MTSATSTQPSSAPQLDPSIAARELIRRQRSREDLIEYSQSIEIPGIPLPSSEEEFNSESLIEQTPIEFSPIESRVAKHHICIMRAIERCIMQRRGRLMIMAPPGSAKSTYASVVATSWAMGRKPNTQVILASYATAIAAKQSRKVRSIVRSPMYAALWPERPLLADDQRAIDDWSLSNGSSLMAAGLLAGITGNRADLLVIDDPIANREQADSDTIRDKIYSEYIDTAMTRAKPWMSVIMIMTRWHELDLMGGILPEDYDGESGYIICRDGQLWDVLCLPAEAERLDDPLGRQPGEFLWPEWFPREHWGTWRDDPRAKRTWAAMFQQRPAPLSGIHFNREMFRWYDPHISREYNH